MNQSLRLILGWDRIVPAEPEGHRPGPRPAVADLDRGQARVHRRGEAEAVALVVHEDRRRDGFPGALGDDDVPRRCHELHLLRRYAAMRQNA